MLRQVFEGLNEGRRQDRIIRDWGDTVANQTNIFATYIVFWQNNSQILSQYSTSIAVHSSPIYCQPHRQATCAAVLSSEVLAAAQTGSNVASPTSRMSVQERKTMKNRRAPWPLLLSLATDATWYCLMLLVLLVPCDASAEVINECYALLCRVGYIMVYHRIDAQISPVPNPAQVACAKAQHVHLSWSTKRRKRRNQSTSQTCSLLFTSLYQKAERVSFLKMIQKSNGQNMSKQNKETSPKCSRHWRLEGSENAKCPSFRALRYREVWILRLLETWAYLGYCELSSQ